MSSKRPSRDSQEGLEVLPDTEGLEPVPIPSEPETRNDKPAQILEQPPSYQFDEKPLPASPKPYPTANPLPPTFNEKKAAVNNPYFQTAELPTRQERRICGMTRRVFIPVFVVIAVLVILIAVLGGVLGSRAAQQTNISVAPAAATQGSPTTTTSTNPSLTTTTLEVLPTQVYTSDCPSANGTVYSITLNNKTFYYRVLCGMAVYNANPNNSSNIVTNTPNLDGCIDQCASVPESGGLPCNAVCWRTGLVPPDKAGIGSCFGYVTANTTEDTFNGNFTSQYCDGAVFIGST